MRGLYHFPHNWSLTVALQSGLLGPFHLKWQIVTDTTPLYIDTPRALDAWLKQIAHEPIVGVDTESDSFHHYREKVCLIQMTAGQADALIDPLALPDLAALQPLLEDPTRIKIFHDAGYDLACLKRDFGFELRGLFDTMLASRLLGARQFGLAAILKERFNFAADKRLQRSNWAQRPLSQEQLAYARYDTHFLPALHTCLREELMQTGRWPWALEEFARLPEGIRRFQARAPRDDADAFWRVQGVKGLNIHERGRLKALHIARERIAQRIDRPVFKVFADTVLLELATHPPQSMADFEPRPGLRRTGIGKYGAELLAALADAQPVREPMPSGLNKRRRSGRISDPQARERYEMLRTMRRDLASNLALDPEVVLSNAVLEDLARQPPMHLDEIKQRPELSGWRYPLFAHTILAHLQTPVAQSSATSESIS